MKTINRCVFSAALSAVCGVGVARAGGFAPAVSYDGLSLSSGVLATSSSPGSVGWRDAWEVQDGTSAVNYRYSDANPLVYPGLQSTPGYASGGNSFQGSGRQLDTRFQGPWDTLGLVSSPFEFQRIDSGKIWVSVLLRKNTFNDTSPAFVSLHQSSIPWLTGFINPRLDIGYFGGEFGSGPGDVNGEKRLGLRFDSVAGDSSDTDLNSISSVALSEGQTALVVVGLDLVANTADLYINPPSLGGAEPATPDAQLNFGTLADGATFGVRSLAWYAGRDAGMGDLDEMRVGTTFASVTPGNVPAFIRGDFNFDGEVLDSDISLFVSALTGDFAGLVELFPERTEADFTFIGDFDGDGEVLDADITGFVNALLGGGGRTGVIPEPTAIGLLAPMAMLMGRRKR